MKVKALLFAFALVIPTLAVADDMAKKDQKADKTTQVSEADKKIMAHVHDVNVMEIDMGKLAQKNATAPVKKYGEMLVKDHTQSDKDLTALAKKKGLAKIPTVQPTEAEKAEHKKQMEEMANLKKLKGADFDREYLRMMVEGHAKELAKSDAFIASTSDADLKTFLETRKTTLQRHEDAAKELQKGNAQAVK